MSRGRGLALVVGVAAIAGLSWWFTQRQTGPVNVVLITLDTVRADRLGPYGATTAVTPRLDELAGTGTMFFDAVSAAPITGPAHAALLTGHYPARFGARDNVTTPLPESAETLAERLAAEGYDTGGFIGAFILDRPYGFAQGFQTFGGFTSVQSGREANAERRGDAVVDEATRWLATRSETQPFFLWVHLYDPHAPYAAPDPFGSQFADSPYDGEIAYTDAQIGRLIDALKANGALDRTVVVAVADHGESLGEHGEDEHGVFLYEPVIRIPWIMSGPGIPQGHRVDDQVRSVDLLPTVLATLGLPVPAGLDGSDLTALVRGEPRATTVETPAAYAESYYPRLHYGWSELRMIRADGFKAIDAPTPELYNLTDDPTESRNLYASQQALADRMIAEAARMDREWSGETPAATAAPDPSTLERLRSLGYIGTSTAPLPTGERGPDPKDRIAERREFKQLMSEAIDDQRAGRPALAIEKFSRLVAINDRAFDLHQMLGEAYQSLGQFDSALGEFEYAALLNPAAASPRLAAAEVHLALGQVAEARRRRDEAAAIDPGSFDVSLVSGRIFEAEGRNEEALVAYQQAVSQNEANPRPRMLLVGVASRLQRFEIAETQLRALLAMGYQPSRTHFALGRIAQMLGRIDDAAQHYRDALRLEPGLEMAAEGLRMIGR